MCMDRCVRLRAQGVKMSRNFRNTIEVLNPWGKFIRQVSL